MSITLSLYRSAARVDFVPCAIAMVIDVVAAAAKPLLETFIDVQTEFLHNCYLNRLLNMLCMDSVAEVLRWGTKRREEGTTTHPTHLHSSVSVSISDLYNGGGATGGRSQGTDKIL